MRKENVILIGFMGSGKSTVGIALSYRLQCVLTDTDKMIERKEGRSISEIFASEGEAYFRQKETELLEKLKKEKGKQIFSVGGGTPLRPENRKLLRELGTVVYLKASPETVYERLRGDTTRPLLQGDDPMGKIKRLLGERGEIYREAADIIVETDRKRPARIAGEIERALKEYKFFGKM